MSDTPNASVMHAKGPEGPEGLSAADYVRMASSSRAGIASISLQGPTLGYIQRDECTGKPREPTRKEVLAMLAALDGK